VLLLSSAKKLNQIDWYLSLKKLRHICSYDTKERQLIKCIFIVSKAK